MKKFYVYVLLLIFSDPGLAEVHIDNSDQGVPPAHRSPNSIIEGNLQDSHHFLVNPICTGALQSPALITDLNAFFEGYAGTRVIHRGDDHYLLMQKSTITGEENLATTARGANTVYAEEENLVTASAAKTVYAKLEFSPVIDKVFVLRAAPDFFSETGMGAASCLAATLHELQEVKS